MPRYLLGLTLAILMSGTAWAQSKVPDNELRLRKLQKLAHNDNYNLRIKRDHCASGKMHNIVIKLEADKVHSPNADVYCRYLLREFGKRKLVWDYYLQITHQQIRAPSVATPELVRRQFELVRDATIAEFSAYVDTQGNSIPFECSLSYDAGYVYGFTNPMAVDFPNLTELKANEIAHKCFTATPQNYKRYGYAAGVFHGRVDAGNPNASFRLY